MAPRSSYAVGRDALIERICEALKGGAGIRAVCRAPGMPPLGTLKEWMRRDPALRARLHAARGWSWQGKPAGREAVVRRLEARLERGLSLHRACREPGAPNYHTVMRWGRQDPQLRARLRRAQARGVQFRPHHNHDRFFYDYDKVDRFLARVSAGDSIVAMQAAREAPDQATVRAWRNMRPEFVERLAAAKRAGAAARRLRPRKAFDAGVADRIVVRVTRGERLADLMREPGMPGMTALARWRRREPEFATALRIAIRVGRRLSAQARAEPSPALTRRIGEAIAGGATIRALCAAKGMPSQSTLRNWRRRYPAVDAEVAAALDFRDWMAADRAVALAEEATPQAQAEARRILGRLRGRGAEDSRPKTDSPLPDRRRVVAFDP